MDMTAALQKLKHYCAYSERCHADVVNKLYELDVWKKNHDEIIATLIQEDFLNEERYTRAFVRGHFYNKKWGRKKIMTELKRRDISAYCIRKGLQEIDEEEYNEVLVKLFEDKWQSLQSEKNRFTKMGKTKNYLLQKGYELELICSLFQQ